MRRVCLQVLVIGSVFVGDRITAWLDSFRGNPMSDEAAAFMYLQLAIEEMPPS